MKTFFKQLFCSHVDKLVKDEILHHSLRADTFVFKVHAQHNECLKCKRIKIEKRETYLGIGHMDEDGLIIIDHARGSRYE